MIITIRVFGRYKDLIGKEHVQLDVTEGNTLQDVVNAFVKQHPQTDKDKKRMMIGLNKIYTSRNTMFHQGDEITITPPVVSGG
jgi:molybdopterin converting factor small subunit